MTSSISLQESSGDALDEATRHLRAVAALLVRVFEAFARLHADDGPTTDTSPQHDTDFWIGLHDLMADLRRTAHDVQRLVEERRNDSPREAPAGAAGAAGVNEDADNPSPTGLATDLARDALAVDLGTIIEEHQDDWAALVHAVRAEKFHGDNGARDDVEPLELYSKVIMTLPVELRRDFRRLTE